MNGLGHKAARLKEQGDQLGERALRHPWVEKLARLGYLAKGVVYAVVGVLALQVAFGQGGEMTDTRGALASLARETWGSVLLAVLAVGLMGYVLWRVVQAWMDPDDKGTGPKGIAVRVGYLVSAGIHASLALAALKLAVGAGGVGKHGDQSAQSWTARLLSEPFGQALVAVVGLVIAGVGVWQVRKAWTEKFRDKLRLGELDARHAAWVMHVCKGGIMARGAVFVLMGVFFLLAALRSNPREARGLDGALAALAEQPHGTVLLAIAAAGLVAYAVYMAVVSRYRRFVDA
ncbi:DUF1206 domain-containing protein [Archangium primigenium]|uniref:DUF1206 domain-containing protein n=1 Tax=[Archangium] primigenium TaxID=2792470 RepID=UPI00195DCFE9|nr:DUF1206 domain-containing protein [Archangium primigenium]MBM7116451.1 DUF1206 domain-containing protein [Archangium primigenium]